MSGPDARVVRAADANRVERHGVAGRQSAHTGKRPRARKPHDHGEAPPPVGRTDPWRRSRALRRPRRRSSRRRSGAGAPCAISWLGPRLPLDARRDRHHRLGGALLPAGHSPSARRDAESRCRWRLRPLRAPAPRRAPARLHPTSPPTGKTNTGAPSIATLARSARLDTGAALHTDSVVRRLWIGSSRAGSRARRPPCPAPLRCRPA